MKAYVDHLLPVFQEGQKAGEVAEGDLEELIACYLSVLSGIMVLNSQEGEGYRIPDAGMLLRIVAGPGYRSK